MHRPVGAPDGRVREDGFQVEGCSRNVQMASVTPDRATGPRGAE